MRLHGINDDGSCMCGWPECPTSGKHPSAKNWSQMPAHSSEVIENWFSVGAVKHGMGVILDKNTVIVDVDEKNGGLKSLQKLNDDLDENIEEICAFAVKSGSGKGSKHFWFTKPEDLMIKKSIKDYPGLDFLSAGCFVVMPGSVHVSGGVYSCYNKSKSSITNITDAPQALLDIIEKKQSISETNAEPGSCDVSELREALFAIPNTEETSYDEVWLPLGMGLHHESNGEEWAFNLWVEWSETGPKHDFKLMRYRWSSFANAPSEACYNGGTVFRIAIEHGWERDYSQLVDIT
ncbi:MAG: bifunctional DNA primase/polymerase, partial [Glaciecola sp.]